MAKKKKPFDFEKIDLAECTYEELSHDDLVWLCTVQEMALRGLSKKVESLKKKLAKGKPNGKK